MSAAPRPAEKSPRDILRSADAVCFDVDSTVCAEEGIDVLAAHCGAGAAVAEWTARAMGGGVPFEDALTARLDLIRPQRQQLEELLAAHEAPLTPGISELVHTFEARGTHVHLISGGFRQMIGPVAERLDLPADRIIANTLRFHADGSFAGHDPDEPTARSGGKARAVQQLIDTHGYRSVVMIGDGVTDAEARPPAAVFIGYGGVADRAPVRERADWFVTDFSELLTALD